MLGPLDGASALHRLPLSQEPTAWDREAEKENVEMERDLSDCATVVLLTARASRKAALTHRVACAVASGDCTSVGHAEPPARALVDLFEVYMASVLRMRAAV
jgi:hypothetical protein